VPIPVTCEACGSKLFAPDSRAGKSKGRCPRCRAYLRVPGTRQTPGEGPPTTPAPALSGEPTGDLSGVDWDLLIEEAASEPAEEAPDPQHVGSEEVVESVIEKRTERLGLGETPFAADFREARELMKGHPDMALTKCRKILESCLNRLHRDHSSEPGTRRLEQLIGDGGRQGWMPRKVLALCEVVRELGNVGSYPIYDDEKLTHREAQIAVLSLMLVLEWYARSRQG
jgi:hypothetical protein